MADSCPHLPLSISPYCIGKCFQFAYGCNHRLNLGVTGGSSLLYLTLKQFKVCDLGVFCYLTEHIQLHVCLKEIKITMHLFCTTYEIVRYLSTQSHRYLIYPRCPICKFSSRKQLYLFIIHKYALCTSKS